VEEDILLTQEACNHNLFCNQKVEGNQHEEVYNRLVTHGEPHGLGEVEDILCEVVCNAHVLKTG